MRQVGHDCKDVIDLSQPPLGYTMEDMKRLSDAVNTELCKMGVQCVPQASEATSPSIKQAEAQLNDKTNRVLDFCIKSLPNGTPTCDNRLRNLINKVCESNNNKIDACHDGRADQYYRIRNQSK